MPGGWRRKAVPPQRYVVKFLHISSSTVCFLLLRLLKSCLGNFLPVVYGRYACCSASTGLMLIILRITRKPQDISIFIHGHMVHSHNELHWFFDCSTEYSKQAGLCTTSARSHYNRYNGDTWWKRINVTVVPFSAFFDDC
jgi:hypothetical protein